MTEKSGKVNESQIDFLKPKMTKTSIYEELENHIAIQIYDYSQRVCSFLKDNSEKFRQFTETLQEMKE